MKNININMLHMKLNSAVSVFAVAAAFSVFLPPSPALGGVCFLPDCAESGVLDGTPEIDINSDSKFCEESGFTYYASAKCPQYQAVTAICDRDEHYLKCDAKTWCQKNGYNTTSCSIPQYVNDPCPSYGSLYKGCKTDNDRACKDTGYTNTCPSGQKLKKESGRCSYDSSYGTCCTPSGCPSYTSTNSSSYGTNGTDGCEYTCYYTCNMNCPSTHPYSSDPTGCSYRTTNGCGNKSCYQYKACCTPTCINETGYCPKGNYQISDGCGSTCVKCNIYSIGDLYYTDGSTSDVTTPNNNKNISGIIFDTDGHSYAYVIELDSKWGNGMNGYYSYGNGWSLPSRTVMTNIKKNISTINKSLKIIGKPDIINYNHWTSDWTNGVLPYGDNSGRSQLYFSNPYTGISNAKGSYECYYRRIKKVTP